MNCVVTLGFIAIMCFITVFINYNLPTWDFTNFVIYSFPIHQYNLVNVDIRSQLVYF